MIGRIFCHPIDTVKARLQASTLSRQSFFGLLQPHNLSLAHWRGLYRGLGVSMLGSAPATCLYLTSYEVSKDYLHSIESVHAHPSLLYLGAGMLAEALSCVLWVPIDVIKERMQVQVPAQGPQRMYYRNTVHAVQTIMATERLGGLYKGYGATLLSFGPFSALYFMFYEKNKAMAQEYLKSTELPPHYTLASAATAGAAASLITNPLDMIKLRLQVQRAYAAEANAVAYTGILDGLTKVIRSEGVLALYKGAGARVAFHAPSTAITMSLFETCRRFFADWLE